MKKNDSPPPKRSMQQVKFTSIDDLLDFLPEDELKILIALRNIVLDQVHGVKEKLSFNVPFYHRHKALCFIWPSSVLWGSKKTFEGVQLGFAYGNMMSDYAHVLQKGNRKQVYMIYFTNINQIDPNIIRGYLSEAELLDQEMFRMKKNK